MPEPSVTTLIKRLVPDDFRARVPFSEDLSQTSASVLTAGPDAETADFLRAWLRDKQPCIFGRMAAGLSDLITFCVLTERDLAGSDSAIREKIQQSRLHWRRRAYLGEKSAFIIAAVSKQILDAAPDANLQRLAMRLAELYLLERVREDWVHHDRVTLEVSPDDYREWVVGVNFFGCQGDGRWWHDHRFPGGLAFSMNSVGHMVRSGAEHNDRASQLAVAAGEKPRPRKKLDTLYLGLRYAMLTINRSSATVSGRATCLRPRVERAGDSVPPCPIAPLPRELAGTDWTTYLGWYDTDFTIPSAYFRPDVERPADQPRLELDFSYLFDESSIDYHRTGPGVRIR
jgi:hypothetical protein